MPPPPLIPPLPPVATPPLPACDALPLAPAVELVPALLLPAVRLAPALLPPAALPPLALPAVGAPEAGASSLEQPLRNAQARPTERPSCFMRASSSGAMSASDLAKHSNTARETPNLQTFGQISTEHCQSGDFALRAKVGIAANYRAK